MATHRKNEVPGNVLATVAMTERILTKTGHVVHMANHSIERLEEGGEHVKAIRLTSRGRAAGEWLAIVTLSTSEGEFVAFHSGDGFQQTLEGTCQRIINGSLKWKEDEYAK